MFPPIVAAERQSAQICVVLAFALDRPAPVESAPLQAMERPPPEPGGGEVRVRVRVCAVCRTDLHVIEGDLPPRRSPIVPGHQVVGIVEKLGPGASRFRPGERVGIAWLRYTDGTCEFCRRGHENLCPQSRYTGWHEDGGYAEFAIVPEAYAYRIPEAFSDDDAAPLLCAGIIGYRALERSEVQPGERLGLYGFGSSAHVTVQVARARGCEVFVMTRSQGHQRLARELGATWVAGADAVPPQPLDGAILFAPVGTLALPALRALRPGGTLAIAGIHLSDIPTMSYEPHLFHEKRLTSVEANTRCDGEALLAEAARIPIRPRVTRFALADCNRALQDLKHDRIDGTALLEVGA
jgi:propanol-preferring alcohol dehydrogenase